MAPAGHTMEELEKQTTPKKAEQSQLKVLIAKGKEQGYLTYAEVNDHLPDGIVDPEQIEDIINMINDMGIKVYESPPDMDIIMTDSTEGPDEELLPKLLRHSPVLKVNLAVPLTRCVCICAKWEPLTC